MDYVPGLFLIGAAPDIIPFIITFLDHGDFDNYLLIRSFIIRERNIPVELFTEALRNENSGYFEAAVITYKGALNAVKNTRFHSDLENKIIENLKLLHTGIEYKNNFHFRQVA